MESAGKNGFCLQEQMEEQDAGILMRSRISRSYFGCADNAYRLARCPVGPSAHGSQRWRTPFVAPRRALNHTVCTNEFTMEASGPIFSGKLRGADATRGENCNYSPNLLKVSTGDNSTSGGDVNFFSDVRAVHVATNADVARYAIDEPPLFARNRRESIPIFG